MNLFFYDVDADYVKYLKESEIAKRGFTRVPDVEYDNERKMVCGVVLEINGYKYYVPVSSYKKKQPNNLLIRLNDDSFNQVKGSLRFNYMFPVDDCYLTKRNFNKETPSRKEFLRRQWVYCNSIIDDIKQMAEDTYNKVIEGADSALINASCDFKLLEDASKKYKTFNYK
jgi:protein AbiQ